MIKKIYQCYIDLNANTTSDYKVIFIKLAINGQSCDKDHLSKFQFKKLDEKVFQATLLTKLDLIKASLKSAKTA